MQPRDVPKTYADTAELEKAVGYKPTTSIQDVVVRFVTWHNAFQKKLKGE